MLVDIVSQPDRNFTIDLNQFIVFDLDPEQQTQHCLEYLPSVQGSPMLSTTLAWSLIGLQETQLSQMTVPAATKWAMPVYDFALDGEIVGSLSVTTEQLTPLSSPSKLSHSDMSRPRERLEDDNSWLFEWTGTTVLFQTFVRLVLDFLLCFLWSTPQFASLAETWRPGYKFRGARNLAVRVALTLTFGEWKSRSQDCKGLVRLLRGHVVDELVTYGDLWQTFQATSFGRKSQKDISHLDMETVLNGQRTEVLGEKSREEVQLPAIDEVMVDLAKGDHQNEIDLVVDRRALLASTAFVPAGVSVLRRET